MSALQSPRDIRLNQIQNRNTNLHAELTQLESHRQTLATQLEAILAETQSHDEAKTRAGAEEEEDETKARAEPELGKAENANYNTGNNTTSNANTNSQTLTTAQAIVQNHIRLLHDYNAIKDIGQGLFGMIADSRGLRLREIHEEFGVDDSD